MKVKKGNKNNNNCPHCGQDLRLPPDAYKQFQALIKKSKTFDKFLSIVDKELLGRVK